jgi:hypothetical protein
VLELGGESGTDRTPTVYPGSYVEYVQKLGHEAPGIYFVGHPFNLDLTQQIPGVRRREASGL